MKIIVFIIPEIFVLIRVKDNKFFNKRIEKYISTRTEMTIIFDMSNSIDTLLLAVKKY